jgi:hypothetical protein
MDAEPGSTSPPSTVTSRSTASSEEDWPAAFALSESQSATRKRQLAPSDTLGDLPGHPAEERIPPLVHVSRGSPNRPDRNVRRARLSGLPEVGYDRKGGIKAALPHRSSQMVRPFERAGTQAARTP